MEKTTILCAIGAAAMMLGGCSTRPRNFAANISTPVSNPASFEVDYRNCQQLVRAGHTSDFVSAAATGFATGLGSVGATATIVGLGGIGLTGTAATAAATAIPVVGLAVGFGVSRAIRGASERKFMRYMETCLSEHGHGVIGWTKLKKREDAAAVAAQLSAAQSVALVSE
jgi:hypothetical protein